LTATASPRLVVIGVVAAACIAAACGVARAATLPGPCGRDPASFVGVDRHNVLWVWLENRSLGSVVGSPESSAGAAAPFLNGIAAECGLATNYHSLTHPSLPNYIAATSGSLLLGGNCSPTQCGGLGRPSLFGAIQQAGMTWRVFAESMTVPCDRHGGKASTPAINPALYFADTSAVCGVWDLPLGTATRGALADAVNAGTFADFTFIVPSLCDSGHDCLLTVVDGWLSQWIPRIVSTSDYQSGRLVVLITWDEGEGGPVGDACLQSDETCHVPLIVLSAYERPGLVVSSYLDHFALLRGTEALLGLAPLRAPSESDNQLVSQFHFFAPRVVSRPRAFAD